MDKNSPTRFCYTAMMADPISEFFRTSLVQSGSRIVSPLGGVNQLRITHALRRRAVEEYQVIIERRMNIDLRVMTNPSQRAKRPTAQGPGQSDDRNHVHAFRLRCDVSGAEQRCV